MAKNEIFGQIGHKNGSLDPRVPLVGDIKYQKLVGKVIGNLFQHQKVVSSPNEDIEDHLRRPNGQKTRFFGQIGHRNGSGDPPGVPWWVI